MALTRVYLRASTSEQDATRARAQVEAFAAEHGLTIAATYIENESGARLARPELFKLLADSKAGDILLVEQVDRLSRLTAADWRKLRSEIEARQVRVVALDLPTSHRMVDSDEFTSRMLQAVNGMLLDMLAAVARKDYEDRRRRQAEGIRKAKGEGKFRGRQENVVKNRAIARALKAGRSWSDIQAMSQCGRATIARVAAKQREGATDCVMKSLPSAP
jgi:DNA invertase Pin-like site-specific DNA recombinase